MEFDDIRPYNDHEYHDIVKKLLKQPVFLKVVNMFFPEMKEEQLTQMLLSYNSINEFQSKFICETVTVIKNRSMKELIYEGLSEIQNQPSRIFMSNHRDIVLDSALINYGLNLHGLITGEIAIGSNLLGVEWVRDLVKLNKSFIVKRNLPIQEMLAASQELSAYIGHTILEKKQSLWIAQREGRAKDGNDETNPGLLKMISMAADNDLLSYFSSLNITPVSISYEYDPCDAYKVKELMAKSIGEKYEKQLGEDEFHMATGINGDKGRVKVCFGEIISEKIKTLSELKNKNQFLKKLALIMDESIQENYFLWPNNYIAADLLDHSAQYTEMYSSQEKSTFTEYIEQRLDLVQLSGNELAREVLLKMYAAPLFNREKLGD